MHLAPCTLHTTVTHPCLRGYAAAAVVSQMAFFAKVSDPRIGGTYMTLLNTVANLGNLAAKMVRATAPAKAAATEPVVSPGVWQILVHVHALLIWRSLRCFLFIRRASRTLLICSRGGHVWTTRTATSVGAVLLRSPVCLGAPVAPDPNQPPPPCPCPCPCTYIETEAETHAQAYPAPLDFCLRVRGTTGGGAANYCQPCRANEHLHAEHTSTGAAPNVTRASCSNVCRQGMLPVSRLPGNGAGC